MKRNLEEIFELILNELHEIDFRAKVNSSNSDKITKINYIVSSVEEILSVAKEHNFSLCQKDESIFIYNGEYWLSVDSKLFRMFLSKAAIKMGVPSIEGKYYQFAEGLYKQFFASADLPQMENDKEEILINLQNGTFVFVEDGGYLKDFNRADFLTYQLPFAFEPEAVSPLFDKYLEQVLPDKSLQDILAEYLGYVFTKRLKMEKCLLLYGNGANGKSVFFEIVNALLGKENITNFALGSLSEEHNRAMIAHKLLNYGSELRSNIEPDILKQLCSGEPIHCRHKYGHPFMCEDYARLMFNCNELPKRTEATEAFFRRFLIIPFDVTIPEEERDVELSRKIIKSELAGIFNWVLKGLDRLLINKKFTDSKQAKLILEEYKLDSDSVALFFQDEGYKPSPNNVIRFIDFYRDYKTYCNDVGKCALSQTNFSRRLRVMKIELTRQSFGMVVHLEKEDKNITSFFSTSATSPTIFKSLYVDNVGSVDRKEDLQLPF